LQLEKELATEGTEQEHEQHVERVAELRARLSEAMANKRAGARRWSASQCLDRRGPTLNAAEHYGNMATLNVEMQKLGGHWGAKTEHGQTFYFDLGRVSARETPMLHRMLREAAGL
jgi:hypothetical protein